ncbi:hypothetical protein MKW92_011388 [Papaver armeniacum]|nr:hypothetical protein MKW92_011388 [Papaver armeniacum]
MSICSQNLLDPDEFRWQGHMIIDFLADYYKNVEIYHVRSQVEPDYLHKRLPESAPNNSESIVTILQDVINDIIPGLTHWQSPNYFAYFPSSGSIAGFLGEILSTRFNVLEIIVMNWMGQMLTLPKSFLFSSDDSSGGRGVLQGTTCEAILCTLTATRDKMLNKIGKENINKLVVYASDQTYCALQKASQIAGINQRTSMLSILQRPQTSASLQIHFIQRFLLKSNPD